MAHAEEPAGLHAAGRLHSMTPEERSLALEVLGTAWEHLAEVPPAAEPGRLLASVQAAAAALPDKYAFVPADYARHVGEAAVWYLDRAVRRVGDPDRDGHTAERRAQNLGWFAARASPAEVERLFAVAAALNADDA